MEFLKIFTVADLVSGGLLVVGFLIKRELHHIGESIKNVKECAIEAKQIASEAHSRIDKFIAKG